MLLLTLRRRERDIEKEKHHQLAASCTHTLHPTGIESSTRACASTGNGTGDTWFLGRHATTEPTGPAETYCMCSEGRGRTRTEAGEEGGKSDFSHSTKLVLTV